MAESPDDVVPMRTSFDRADVPADYPRVVGPLGRDAAKPQCLALSEASRAWPWMAAFHILQ